LGTSSLLKGAAVAR